MVAVISTQRVSINNKLLLIAYTKCLPKVVINFHLSWVYHHADVPAMPVNLALWLNYFPQADNILWFLIWRKLRILRSPTSSLKLIWRTTMKKKIAVFLLDCFLFLADSSVVPGHSSHWTGWTSLKWSRSVWVAQELCFLFVKHPRLHLRGEVAELPLMCIFTLKSYCRKCLDNCKFCISAL